MMYALCAETGEKLAVSWGKRNRAGVRRLIIKLKKVQIDTFCTDYGKAFKEVLPEEKDVSGKQHTKKDRRCQYLVPHKAQKINAKNHGLF